MWILEKKRGVEVAVSEGCGGSEGEFVLDQEHVTACCAVVAVCVSFQVPERIKPKAKVL